MLPIPPFVSLKLRKTLIVNIKYFSMTEIPPIILLNTLLALLLHQQQRKMMMIHAVFSAKQDCQPTQSFIPINATSCFMLIETNSKMRAF